MLRLLCVIALSLICFAGRSQYDDVSRMRPAMLKNLARNADRLHDTYSAIRYYTAYHAKRPSDIGSLYRLAQLEESARFYAEARKHYAELDERNSKQFEMALYDKARMLKMEADYDLAKTEFKRFMDRYGKDMDKELKKIVTNEMNGCDTALMLMKKPIDVEISNMGDEVNHPHIEFSPIPTGETTLIFGGLPETGKTYFDVLDETPKRKFFTAYKDRGKWFVDGELDGPMNFPDAHSGNGVYSADGKRFYYTRCEENWKLEVECEIWVCFKTSSGWLKPVKLSDDVNMSGFSSTQPAIGFDAKKKKEILYFVSNRPGGFGGSDIWYVVYDPKKDTYSEAKNAGKYINTARNEVTPFYYEKERKLYFSSDGRSGLGGLDIYSARGEMKSWGPVSNIGYPINTSVDELYYALKPSGESGYFVSNRSGGHNLLQATCCDDIYEFQKTHPVHLAVRGSVVRTNDTDYINGKSDELRTAITDDMLLGEATVDVYILEGNAEILMQCITTDSKGSYFLDLEENKQYKLVLGKDGYLNNIVEFSTINKTRSDTLLRNVGLARTIDGSIILENIEYEFDSAELTPLARTRIDEALLKVLIENPTIKVEIGSHTDSRGTEEYNQKLSQQRAESVVKYLTSRGIEAKRLSARGYGESRPVAPNQNPDGSDNESGRQKNRRTEFRIVGKIDLPKKSED